jgi:threonyl-tRNA synthetase
MGMTIAAQEALAKDEGLFKKRHSLAHVLAEAVRQIFPDAQVAIGPPIDNGFYYDFELPRSLNEEDFPVIEEKMRAILATKARFEKRTVSRAQALKVFAGQKYKEDLINKLPEAEEISIYKSHEFEDFCRGPHVESMAEIDPKCFKISRVAGAYWRGDEKNAMLQRVYAYAFNSEKELSDYLAFLEEAEKRDHRKIGREMDLFHVDPEDPGQVFWHPNGWAIYLTIQNYVREKVRAAGYVEVHTPMVMPQSLWERSGHWAKYRENMFITESEKRTFALKPMNCPGAIEIFKQGIKSYRDLPLRMAEFGSCTRNEASGALLGILRVRGFVQDDAHIFCTEEQIPSEVASFCALLKDMYKDFGFTEDRILVKFSTRPELRVGDDATWDRAEAALADACKKAALAYEVAPGEGAFYGPKLEFTLVDALGRQWQCGTIQVDYQLPSKERLDAEYTAEDGSKKHPVMLHRAILGSLERFIGILIEQYSGTFPVWLAPEQVAVISVSEKFSGYAFKVAAQIKAAGYRVEADLSDQKMGAKIRAAQMRRVPYMLIVGGQEEEADTVSLRTRSGEQKNGMSLPDFIQFVAEKIAAKADV